MADFPLRDRIYRSKDDKKPNVEQERPSAGRPSSYKNWDKMTMTAACKAAKTCGQRRAAEEYGIPRSTLGDHYRGKLLPGAKSGRSKYLTDAGRGS